jgi:predicted ribosomally synthesized peptide with SipW-like signal peptide
MKAIFSNKKVLLSVGMIVFMGAMVAAATGAFFSDQEVSTGNTFTAGAIDLKIDSVQHYNGMVCAENGVETGEYVWVPVDEAPYDADQHPIMNDNFVAETWNSNNPNAYPQAGVDCTGSWRLKDLGGEQATVDRFFDFDDVKPGDQGENTISLHVETNDAYMCVALANVGEADNGQTEPEAADDANGDDGAELDEALQFRAWVDEGVEPGFQGNDPYEGDNVWQDGERLLGSARASELTDTVWALAEGGDAPILAGTTGYLGLSWCVGEFDDNGYCDGTEVNNASQTDSWYTDIMFYITQSRNNDNFSCDNVWDDKEEVREPVVELGSVDFEDYAGARFRSFGNTGANELYAGEGDLGNGANRSEAGYTWVTPGSHDVEVSYDSTLNQVTAMIGGTSVTHTAGLVCEPDALQFSIVARDAGTSVALNNVDLGGNALGDFLVSEGDASEWVTWNVSGFDFSSDFTFSGDLDLNGSFGSSQELSKVQVDFGCSTN